MVRHFLDIADHDAATLRAILADAARMKAARRTPAATKPLAGKTLAMIFDKPSTRTRVSFDVGMRDLGGETIMLTGGEMQLGRGEIDRRYRPRPVALCRCHHDPRARSCDGEGAGGATPPFRSSTASRAFPIPARSWPMS